MLSIKWKKEINKNKNKANNHIKMILKHKKEPIKFLKNNLKNYFKGHNQERNERNTMIMISILISFILIILSLNK